MCLDSLPSCTHRCAHTHAYTHTHIHTHSLTHARTHARTHVRRCSRVSIRTGVREHGACSRARSEPSSSSCCCVCVCARENVCLLLPPGHLPSHPVSHVNTNTPPHLSLPLSSPSLSWPLSFEQNHTTRTRIVTEVLIVCPNVKDHGQNTVRRNTSGRAVQGQFTDRNSCLRLCAVSWAATKQAGGS